MSLAHARGSHITSVICNLSKTRERVRRLLKDIEAERKKAYTLIAASKQNLERLNEVIGEAGRIYGRQKTPPKANGVSDACRNRMAPRAS
jgi:hypothetical protein